MFAKKGKKSNRIGGPIQRFCWKRQPSESINYFDVTNYLWPCFRFLLKLRVILAYVRNLLLQLILWQQWELKEMRIVTAINNSVETHSTQQMMKILCSTGKKKSKNFQNMETSFVSRSHSSSINSSSYLSLHSRKHSLAKSSNTLFEKYGIC